MTRLVLVVSLVLAFDLARTSVLNRADSQTTITGFKAVSFAVLPNGDLVISQDRIQVLDVKTGQITRSFQKADKESGYFEFLQVLQNGDVLAGGYYGEAYIFNINDGSVKLRIKEGGLYAQELIELANGDIAQSSQYENIVNVFDRQTGKSKIRLEHEDASGVSSLHALPNGDLAAASASNKVIIWDIVNKSPKFLLYHQIHKDGLIALELLSDGNLVSVSKEGLIVWDPNQGKELYRKEFSKNIAFVKQVVALSSGRLAVTSGKDVEIVSLSDGSFQKTLKGHTKNIQKLATLPDGRLVSLCDNKEINIWTV